MKFLRTLKTFSHPLWFYRHNPEVMEGLEQKEKGKEGDIFEEGEKARAQAESLQAMYKNHVKYAEAVRGEYGNSFLVDKTQLNFAKDARKAAWEQRRINEKAKEELAAAKEELNALPDKEKPPALAKLEAQTEAELEGAKKEHDAQIAEVSGDLNGLLGKYGIASPEAAAGDSDNDNRVSAIG